MMDLEELGEKYEEFISRFSTAVAALTGSCFSQSSGLIYHLNKVVRMVVENAPFKKGDRVELIEDLDIKKDSGWYCQRHNLCKGKQGEVGLVEIWDNSKDKKPYYVVYFRPDNQTRLCGFGKDEGKYLLLKESYVYPIPACRFRKVE